MKKRILSFLLALLMIVSIIPITTYAEDSTDVTIAQTQVSAGDASESADAVVLETLCDTCGLLDCTSEHLTWCAECKKDDCGVDHTVAIATQPCDKCGSTECNGHENWCDLCKMDSCGKEHKQCETCGNVDCIADHVNWCEICQIDNCGREHVFCDICQKNDCGIEHKEKIEIPACSGAPTCWGEQNQEPLQNHVDGCVRKEYLKVYVSENTAESIADYWPNFTDREKADVISMAEAYTAYAEALKLLVQWGVEPEEPKCDCGITEDVQHHAVDCPLYLHWVKTYVEELSVQDISGQWMTLDKSTRESILAILEENASDKLAELEEVLPDMIITKDTTVAGTEIIVAGDIPVAVILDASSVKVENYNSAIYDYIPNSDAILFAFDVTLSNPDGSKWQPYSGETVTVTLDAVQLGLADGERVRLLHDHDGSVEDLGTYNVANGVLSFKMDKFSTIYAVPITTVSQNAYDGIIYFDLNAGNVTIDGSNYTGYRFDGTDTAKEVTGTLEAGQSYYVYQSNATNKNQTGLINNGTEDQPVYEIQLPSYSGVTINNQSWGDYITNNTDVKAVINAWNKAYKDDRTATGNHIDVRGVVSAEMVIDNVWSTYSDHGASRETGAISFQPGGETESILTLCIRGDNRVECVHYWSSKGKGNQIIFRDYDSTGNKNTITVADIDLELVGGHTGNYWCSAIGGDDGSRGNADGIVINSGIIYAGTTAEDDCTAIGGGGNDYGGVTINGGIVTAVTSSSGTAIGGGIGKTSTGGQSKVVITNGTVYAYNFSCESGTYSQTGVKYIPAAAIGGGSSARSTCNSCTVEIHGGYVFARSVGGTAIGGGSSADTHGGASVINITGGTVDVASLAGTIGGQAVKAGASIGGGTGGTNGNGGDCTLTISGGTVYTGSIGGGKTISTKTTNHIGSATVKITAGTVQGQVIMASGAASDCSFNMIGGTIDNTAVLNGTKNADGDIEFTRDEGTYNRYTFLEENGGAVYVENGVATLSGGTVQNIKATNGGAFYVTGGTFEMTGGEIKDSSATENGGAICIESGTARITNGTISSVSAPNGGAVYVNVTNPKEGVDDFTMNGGTIRSFFATENGGAVCVMGGTAKVGGFMTGSGSMPEAKKGGAVYVGGGNFEMTGGSMTDCNASTMGGAVCVEKVGETYGTAIISSGEISNVYAPNGGAIAVSGGSFTMSGGAIFGVKATYDGELIDGLGGAVYVNDGSAKVAGGSITGHETEPEAGSGGGVYVQGGSFVMSGGTMANFNVTGNGGMVCVTGEGAAATIQGGTISGNPAAGVSEAANGGAVYVGGGNFTINGQGKIINCNATQSGGGVYLDDGTFTVQGGSFENCTAVVNGGGVYMGSGTFNMNGGSFNSCAASEYGGGVYLGGGTFDLGGNGSFESCTAIKDGGGVYLADGTFEMPGGSVKNCSAKNGGGVYLAGGTFNMDGGTFESCSVNANGGAVCIMNGTANIKGGTIQGDNTVIENVIYPNNLEAIHGGGIYVGGGKLDMEAGTITKCSATKGGAAYITAGECDMTGGMVSYNYADDGGAMYVENTPVTYGGLNNLTVEWNFATNNGGGMFINNEGKHTTITNGVIRNNTADNFGGGIYHEGENGSCTVSGAGQIRGNTAKNGGGLYIIGGSTLNVNGGHITENRAVGKPAVNVTTAYNHTDNVGVGGGVYVGPGTTITSSFTMAAGKAAGIYANTADFAADDLYANIDSTVLSLPDVDGMSLGDSMTATGWYCDYAEGDTRYNDDTLLVINQFPNPDAVTDDSIERYRHAAEYSETAPYRVNESLGNVSRKYICLTIGSNIINFGKIVISKEGSENEDQYFVFKVEASILDNTALERPVFEVAIRGNDSIEIDHVPFGTYTITEMESWSWRYEVADGQASQSVTVEESDTAETVTFTNKIDVDVAFDTQQQSSLWLDGNSQNKVNVWNQKQVVSQNTWNLLFGKEDAD